MEHEQEAWRKCYREDGFVVVRNLLDPETLSTALGELEKISGDLTTLPPHLRDKVFLERQHVQNNPHWYAGVLTPEECGDHVRQIDDLALFSPTFARLICYPPLLDVLEVLFESSEFSFNYLHGRPKVARYGNGISNGNYHRDTPFEEFTAVNTILAILCLHDMTDDNGATSFIPGSHKVSDEEAKQWRWREVPADSFRPEEKFTVNCPAGAGIFFNTKVLHAAGHNRSARPRHTLICEWVGADVLPTSAERHAYQGLKPRSKDPAFARQIELTFTEQFATQS